MDVRNVELFTCNVVLLNCNRLFGNMFKIYKHINFNSLDLHLEVYKSIIFNVEMEE